MLLLEYSFTLLFFFFDNFYIKFFYICAILAIISGFLIIIYKNPIHAIFALIISFAAIASMLFYFLSCDFLAIIFLIVYVGAVSILFLFIVMLLNIKNIDMEEQYFNYLPMGFLGGGILLLQMSYFVTQGFNFNVTIINMCLHYKDFLNALDALQDLEVLAVFLYEEYYILFIWASLLLLIAMLGAIILTVRISVKIKKQYISAQVFRKVKLKTLNNL